jgi:hypothetical protein
VQSELDIGMKMGLTAAVGPAKGVYRRGVPEELKGGSIRIQFRLLEAGVGDPHLEGTHSF